MTPENTEPPTDVPQAVQQPRKAHDPMSTLQEPGREQSTDLTITLTRLQERIALRQQRRRKTISALVAAVITGLIVGFTLSEAPNITPRSGWDIAYAVVLVAFSGTSLAATVAMIEAAVRVWSRR